MTTLATPDCAGTYEGSATSDNCGVCSGGDSGHVADSDIDDCGVCFGGHYGDYDGDGTCDYDDPSPYGEVSLSSANASEGTIEILYNSDMPIYGFQFQVAGVTLTAISSGSGFDLMSFSETTGSVIAASLSGASLAAGDGSLVTLSFIPTLDGSVLSITDLVIGGQSGTSILSSSPSDASIPSCANNDADLFCNVADSWPNCSDTGSDPYDECNNCNGDAFETSCVGNDSCNDMDCSGECGQVAANDTCGECSGGNSGHVADSDQDDCGVCFGTNIAASGDINNDALVSILDVVLMVSHVIDDSFLFDSCGLLLGDVNDDNVVNIIDIILVIEDIMYGDLARTDELLQTAPTTLELNQRSNSLGYITDKPGLIGFEMTLSHEYDFSIALNEDSFIADYKTSGNETKIIIVMEGGSELFTTTGNFEIMDMMVGTLLGELFNVTINLIPDNFKLGDAYPNPFNPTTSVELAIPQDGFVSIKIYNLMGQVVATLHEGDLTANNYTFIWYAVDVASGMYLLQAEAAGNVAVQKIMLMK
jgi:hypothetical protein